MSDSGFIENSWSISSAGSELDSGVSSVGTDFLFSLRDFKIAARVMSSSSVGGDSFEVLQHLYQQTLL